jgi:hypothetical protein
MLLTNCSSLKGFDQERDSTSLHCLAPRFFLPVSGYENRRDGVALVSEVALDL